MGGKKLGYNTSTLNFPELVHYFNVTPYVQRFIDKHMKKEVQPWAHL
jgi:hypothetical protein